MITPKQQIAIADQLDLVVRQLATQDVGSRELWQFVRPLLRSVPGSDSVLAAGLGWLKLLTVQPKPSDLVAWHNAADGEMKANLGKAIKLIVRMNSRVHGNHKADPRAADKLTTIAERIRLAANDPDAERKRGLELWNAGSTWRQVNAELGREPDQHKGTAIEIRRYAKDIGVKLVSKKPGRPSGT